MKFTVNQRDILYALNILTRAVSSRTTMEILKGIYIEALDDHLVMKSNDLSMSIIVETPALVEEKGSCVIESSLFNNIIRKFPDDAITLHKKEDHIALICGQSNYKLMMMDEESFPQIREVSGGKTITLNQSVFSNMIKMTNFAVSKDETRAILTGSLLEVKNGEMKMVSIDGYNIAIKKIGVTDVPDVEIIIPGRTLAEIQKIIGYNVDDDIELTISDNHVSFNFDNVTIISKVLEGEYIKYEQVISSDFSIDVELDKNEFYRAIERASLMANESRTFIVIFDFKKDHVLISSDSEMGQAREEVDIVNHGQEIRIGFNPNYLLRALRVMEEDELLMRMSSSVRPCFIKPMHDDSYEYYLVPIRINN